MDRSGGIRVFEDQGFQRGMVVASLAVLVVGAVLGVVVVVGTGSVAGLLQGASEAGVGGVLLFLLAMCASFVVHELVHGFFFKVFAPAGSRVTFGANWKVGMLYACAEGIVYTRRQYQVIIVAPTVVVTVVLLAGGVLLGHVAAGYLLAVLHLSGCTGDWGYLVELARYPGVDRCVDADWGVRFLQAGEDA